MHSYFFSSHIIFRYWPQFAYLLRRLNGTVARTFLPKICIVRTVHVINSQPGRSRPLAFVTGVIGELTLVRRRYNRSASTRSVISSEIREQELIWFFVWLTHAFTRSTDLVRFAVRDRRVLNLRIGPNTTEHDRRGSSNLPCNRPEQCGLDRARRPRYLPWTGRSLWQVSENQRLRIIKEIGNRE